MDALQRQIEELRGQMKDDFRLSMLAVSEVTKAMAEATKRMGVVEGRMARQEERFEAMLDLVQRALSQAQADSASKADLWALERRLEALERKPDSAA